MSKRLRRIGRSEKEARHVRLYHWMLSTAAWQSLDATARAVYLDIATRYNGSNNGRIPYSVREAASALHIGQTTAVRALRVLVERGFLVTTRRGQFGYGGRHASEWRLTEFACDVTGALASKEFARWRPIPGKLVVLPIRNYEGPKTRGPSSVTGALRAVLQPPSSATGATSSATGAGQFRHRS